MLLELWERLLGRSNWISTQATIVAKTSADEIEIMQIQYERSRRHAIHYDVKLQWHDQAGQQRTGIVRGSQRSPLYSLAVGTVLPLRYNPADPESWYLPRLLRRQVLFWISIVAVLFACAVAVMTCFKPA